MFRQVMTLLVFPAFALVRGFFNPGFYLLETS